MYFIGIDVSKAKVDACLIDSTKQIVQQKTIKNTPEQLGRYLRSVRKQLGSCPVLVCSENTGIYGVPLTKACVTEAIDLWVEDPFKIKRATTDLRGKTDQKDAYRIACYAVRYQDTKRLYKPLSPWAKKVKTLVQAREDLIQQKQALAVRLKEAKSHDSERYEVLEKAFGPALIVLEQQIKQSDQEIDQLIKQHEPINTNFKLLKSIPGVGKQNAVQIILHTDNFTRFTPKQLACQAGVAPFPNQSGKMNKPDRVSKHANQTLKRLLHMAAMSAIGAKSDLRDFYIRKVAEGKNKMSVINAVRNKLIHRMFAVIKRQQPYVLDQKEFLSKQENACLQP